MYCSECGAGADGKFCWKCGAPLRVGPGPAAASVATSVAAPGDWADEVRYEVLLSHPEVRDRIAREGAKAATPLSGETLLKVFDKLALSTVPLETVGEVGVRLWTSLGVKSGVKTRMETIPRPCGHLIVAALGSLARRSQALTGVDQAADGCTLHGELPSDYRSLRGEIRITLVREGRSTRVDAGAWSKGQFFDWGKSQSSLDRLFSDLRGWSVTD